MSFFSGDKRTAGAKALDFTTFFALHRLDFMGILQGYSDDNVFLFFSLNLSIFLIFLKIKKNFICLKTKSI